MTSLSMLQQRIAEIDQKKEELKIEVKIRKAKVKKKHVFDPTFI